MKKLNTRAINNINISGINTSQASFKIFVVMAITEENSELLNRRSHKHNFFEIHFITDGYLGYDFGDKAVTVNSGEMLVISPGNAHRVSKIPDSFCKITIGVEAKPGSAAEKSLLNLSDKVVPQGEGISNAIEHVMSVAREKNDNKNKAMLVHLSISAVIYRIIGKTGIDCTESITDTVHDDRVLSAKKYIDDNPDIFFTCTEVASYCQISAKQLGRLFRSYEGMSLLEYIHKVKTEQAKNLLLRTDDSQAKIAKDLGFLDSQYFGRFFQRITGITPAVFRAESSDKYKEDIQ
ncbi:MAG: AraC family transcriptional regulator [Clostridia bacterium]|nr:AraC family transcriptional regulator [Clostridia bacterium]